jgi:hypothetical protein
MLGISWVAAQLATSQERLSSMSEWVSESSWSSNLYDQSFSLLYGQLLSLIQRRSRIFTTYFPSLSNRVSHYSNKSWIRWYYWRLPNLIWNETYWDTWAVSLKLPSTKAYSINVSRVSETSLPTVVLLKKKVTRPYPEAVFKAHFSHFMILTVQA